MRRFGNHFSLVPLLLCALFFAFAAASPLSAQENGKDAVALFNEGQDAHEKGDLKKAVALYREALEITDFPEGRYQLGAALLAAGDSAAAETELRHAIELREDWSLPMSALAGILVRRGAYAEASALLDKAIALDDGNLPAFVALAELKIATNAPVEALKPILEKLRAATSKASPTASAWTARGAIERRLGDLAAARSSIARALALEPADEAALGESIETSLAGGDAAAALETALRLDKSTNGARSAKLTLARVYAENGKPAEALAVLEKLGDADVQAAELRRKIRESTSDNAAELEKSLAADPKNATVLGRLCALLRRDDPARALEFCRRASEAEPSNVNHVVGYGAALVQAKQYAAAADLLRKILAIAPENYTARANLATSLFQLKRLAEAKTEFRTLAEMQPATAITYYFLAIVHDQLGEYMDAMANYQQFMKLADPNRHQLEMDKVNLRLPSLQKQIKENKGKK